MTIPPQRRRKKFVNFYEHAIQRLMASGITTEQIESLRDFGLMARCNVTGYYEGRSGKGRFWTLEEAIRHVKETGCQATIIPPHQRQLLFPICYRSQPTSTTITFPDRVAI